MNDKCITISIVTPSLNQAQFIEQTIKSVISQAGDFFLEYLIMDAGSTDGSLDIIKRYDQLLKEKKFPVACKGIEYKWVSEPDKGQADAINKGLRMSHGEVISYLNSDDLYNPGAFSRLAAYFMKYPYAGAFYGDSLGIELDGQVRQYKIGPEKFSFNAMKKKNRVFQPATFLSRKVLGRPGYLDISYHYTMDYDWFVRIARYFKGVYIPVSLGTFRRHATTKTHDRYFVDYRAEYIAVILKYGGLNLFSRTLGDNIIQLINSKGTSLEQAFSSLREAIIKVVKKRGDAIATNDLERAFLKGRAYAYLRMSYAEALNERKQAKQHFLQAISGFPCLLANRYSLRTLIRLLFSRKNGRVNFLQGKDQ